MFLISTIISIVFLLCKFIEIKFIEKESNAKPIKYIVRDGLLVYFSSLLSFFLYDQISPMIGSSTIGGSVNKTPIVFTDNPTF
jgi:hypothetical protein